jgi:hypothetical protein
MTAPRPGDQEAIARFVVRVAKCFGTPATIVTRRARHPTTCCNVCGLDDGTFERVTYAGAPDGGVLVHNACVLRFFRRLDAGWPVPGARDGLAKSRSPGNTPGVAIRARRVAEINRLIKAAAFVPRDFFLTQAPPPVWIWQNASARYRWGVRERRRRSIAQLMAHYGLTAHDLTLKVPELPPATVPLGKGTQAHRESEPKMDMSKYAGSQFLRVADLQEQGSFKAKIIDIEIGEKFGKPNMTLSEGSILSLNVTNCGTLIRAYGANSDDWIGREIELYVGDVEYDGKTTPAIMVKPISPGPESKAAIKPQKKKRTSDDLAESSPDPWR